MKKVMVFGTFDILHDGHIDFLRQAKRHGDQLMVVVGTDRNVEKVKHRKPLHGIADRIKNLASLDLVDEVVAGDETDLFRVVAEKMPDVICLGYDQDSMNVEDEINARGWNISVVRLKPYKEHKHKSSLIRQKDDTQDSDPKTTTIK